jgi:hypothetical protein
VFRKTDVTVSVDTIKEVVEMGFGSVNDKAKLV